MNKFKRLGILLIITSLILIQIPVSEVGAQTPTSDFKIKDDVLVSYKGSASEVTVPDSVAVIGKSAFEDNDFITKVKLPGSVTEIKEYAFWGCDNLETVSLGSGLKSIGDFSFTNCKGLKEMTIPSNVETIGIDAFEDCVNLEKITIPYQVREIHETSFDGCYKLVIDAVEGSYAYIYAQEFYKRQQEMPVYEDLDDYEDDQQLNIDSSDSEASDENNSYPLYNGDDNNIYGSVKVVGNQAVVFIDNAEQKVFSGNDITNDNGNINSQIITGDVVNDGITKYTVVDGRIIADQAYYKNSEITNITVPSGIEEIGQFSYARSSLKSISLPEGVKRIDYGAFYHCDELSSINLPDSVEVIEPKAFEHTGFVQDFMDNSPENFLIVGNCLLKYKGDVKNPIIPDYVKVIAAEAFYGNSYIQSVVIPSSVVTVGEAAFENCENLSSVELANGVRYIKDRAFYGCNVKEFTVPMTVSEIGIKAFDANVNISFDDEENIKYVYENSATRLSNEKYRVYPPESDKEKKISIIDNSNYFSGEIYAALEGIDRYYELYIGDSHCSDGETVCLSLKLTDESNIPLNKLGKRTLTLYLPVPEQLINTNVIAYITDRNGQLERISCERCVVEGVDMLKIATNYVSGIKFFSMGELSDEEVFDYSTTIKSMSANAQQTAQNNYSMKIIKYLVAFSTFVTGVILLTIKKKKRN